MKSVLSGENAFELQKELDLLVNNFVKEHGDLALERMDGEEVTPQKLVDVVTNLPFLASKKMVVVKNVYNKDLLEKLVELEVPDFTELIVVAGKLDKRASYYKKLSKLSGFKSFTKQAQVSLPQWIMDEVAGHGGKISRSDAQYLVDILGDNQMLLSSEVNKLTTYSPDVTRETIDLLCEPTPQATTFNLIDSAFTGNLERSLNLYKELRAQKVEPIKIMGLMAWQLHVLATVKMAGSRGSDQIAKDAKLNPYVVSKSKKIADGLSLKRVKYLVHTAMQLDLDMKSKSINTDDAMMLYIADIAKGQ